MPLPIPQNPFSHDLGVKIVPGKDQKKSLTLCCHGYGHNHEIVDIVHSNHIFSGNLVGFNFPDHDITPLHDHHKSFYGSIDEILPLLYLMKYYVCDQQMPNFNLYGFSAGGGAIVNALAILNQQLYQERLQSVGISNKEIKQIISALENGLIILDCPLKSMREIVASRGFSPELEILATRYEKNKMNPLDVLSSLSGLKLTIILNFQNPDEILSNRDDKVFIERLKKANKGKTTVITGLHGGHNTYHRELCNYLKILDKTLHV